MCKGQNYKFTFRTKRESTAEVRFFDCNEGGVLGADIESRIQEALRSYSGEEAEVTLTMGAEDAVALFEHVPPGMLMSPMWEACIREEDYEVILPTNFRVPAGRSRRVRSIVVDPRVDDRSLTFAPLEQPALVPA